MFSYEETGNRGTGDGTGDRRKPGTDMTFSFALSKVGAFLPPSWLTFDTPRLRDDATALAFPRTQDGAFGLSRLPSVSVPVSRFNERGTSAAHICRRN
jgi:hypothetical protein